MSQSFATAFYHSHNWVSAREAYLNALVDTSGHVVVQREVGGGFRYFRQADGREVRVPDSLVVPPGMCERCFQMGQLRPATLVHHKIHLTPENISDPSVSLSFDNFQRLCVDCHAFVHSGKDEPRVVFDDDGTARLARPEGLQSLVMQLTETVDERRNMYASKSRHAR